jgi:hypothetical protein
MSSVNYSLNRKGVRLISSKDAWVIGKNGKTRLNPKYTFVGKMEFSLPNMIVTASSKHQPTYKGDVCELNQTAKSQIIKYFYGKDGKRNKKTVAFFGIEKTNKK